MTLPDKIRRQVYRQASYSVARLLNADASKTRGSSVEALTLAPHVVAKKATHALTCETLRYLPVLRELLQGFDFRLATKKRIPDELLYVLVYDLLFGQGLLPCGDAERAVGARRAALRARLARLVLERQVASPKELLPLAARPAAAPSLPRYVRVNMLKLSVEEAVAELQALSPSLKVAHDDLVPELLVLPPGTELHAHPLVASGALVLQGKASCLPARALAPEPSWEVLDACAAPGNKTTHLAALMGGGGRVVACELDAARAARLRQSVARAGATNVEVLQGDFLKLDPSRPSLCNVKGLLLDPSCSGSGTKAHRMDHILPSAHEGDGADDPSRLRQLSAFQRAALRHALSFPALERLVYSTCSVHEEENEGVVAAVLPFASARGFHLATPFPGWPHRGRPAFDGAHHLLRTDPERDRMDGFFVALFVRQRGGGAAAAEGDPAGVSKDSIGTEPHRGPPPPAGPAKAGAGGGRTPGEPTSGKRRAQAPSDEGAGGEAPCLPSKAAKPSAELIVEQAFGGQCDGVADAPAADAARCAQERHSKGSRLSQLRRRRLRRLRKKQVQERQL